MDPRLLLAIGDVFGDAGITFAVESGFASAAAGRTIRDSMLAGAALREASTGTPIRVLRGIAASDATLAAVAGGAKAAGGGGKDAGARMLGQASTQVRLAVCGTAVASLAAVVGVRYAVRVGQDRKAAREAVAADDD
ncbi:hypothetical protein ACX8Z9_04575 [Arthrobacter halodurans]|uniref:Uncharacterized protein n=1 Tax=Arthrobacter halodurans TaxID=516699 RepID=A0ABV4UQI7_9MICC